MTWLRPSRIAHRGQTAIQHFALQSVEWRSDPALSDPALSFLRARRSPKRKQGERFRSSLARKRVPRRASIIVGFYHFRPRTVSLRVRRRIPLFVSRAQARGCGSIAGLARESLPLGARSHVLLYRYGLLWSEDDRPQPSPPRRRGKQKRPTTKCMKPPKKKRTGGADRKMAAGTRLAEIWGKKTNPTFWSSIFLSSDLHDRCQVCAGLPTRADFLLSPARPLWMYTLHPAEWQPMFSPQFLEDDKVRCQPDSGRR